MGFTNIFETTIERYKHPEESPDCSKPPTFDSHFGFDGRKRKLRDPSVTEDEVRSANISMNHRNYCAKYFIKLMHCHQKNRVKFNPCSYESHNYQSCLNDDAILRIYEYERERRLKSRQLKLDKLQKVFYAQSELVSIAMQTMKKDF
ncbi:NADH dehydrogenase [ubiquinone] 1 beta subcomplex subunit 7 [Intoshia linei]|uniref:NADH dehydrogenase [ubiquinone] 1 beta subcomplex subunit 7 n=1 Tax=Intoshia linei TaxID=1819745 RepID=A0A177B261_9BILA|nr:NADH dehydrogenase [ubiquinone] 1 beta subcomplex subunit 7 [Intoshia linei]